MPVANKPILFYGLEDMVEAGINEIGIIVGDTERRDHAPPWATGRAGASRSPTSPRTRRSASPTASSSPSDFLGDDDFVMYLGDNLLQQGVDAVRRRASRRPGSRPHRRRRAPAAQILLARVDDPQRFGVAEIGPDGEVVGWWRSPHDPPSDLALVGVYLFDATIHEAVRAIEPSGRGELEITDAIQWLIDQGHRVRHEVLDGWWIDTGKKDALLEGNRLILETLEPADRRRGRRRRRRSRAAW